MSAVPTSEAPWRWTALVGVGLRVGVEARAHRLSDLEFWTRESGAIQRRQLSKLLSRARHTDFGREHRFARLARLEGEDQLRAYREGVPHADWYAFGDRIARMREGGEPDVLWPGLVRDFAQTSGTTAGDKFIPVSRAMLRSNLLASMDIFANMLRRGVSLPWLTSGRSVFMGGSSDLQANEHGIRTADLSGLVTPMIRWPLSEVYAPGHDIALMDHWPTKIDAMARACIDMDVRMLSGMPSWANVLFMRLLELASEQGRDATCVKDLWPNFTLFVHGGVKYTPFVQRVNEVVFGDKAIDFPHRLELYPASEAFIAMQDIPGDPGLRLLTDIGVFYEFIPLEEIDDSQARAFTCDTVEKGQRYVVVLSTCAGLWRYVLGDVVEFDTIPAALNGRGGDGPARLRIVGRHRHFINAFGENLIVEHIDNAVASAARETGLTIGEFTAAPVYPQEGRSAGLELAIELEDERLVSVPPTAALSGRCDPLAESTPGVLKSFRDAFDASLKAQNVDYTTKRTDGLGMGPPTITALPIGAFHRWMESRGKLGGQHKCPRCANHRDVLDGVLSCERGSTPIPQSADPEIAH